MKRYGEKAIREALNAGVIIRNWAWFTLQAGYKVTKDGETIGYITFDLFCKLLDDGTIVKTHSGYSYTDYAIVIEEKEGATEEKESATEEKESATEEWCAEIPQNENIDFWQNYSN